MPNAFIYKRLSDKDQSNYSLSNQDRQTEEYCKRHGLTVKATFEDNGESSYTFDRKGYTELELAFQKHKVQYIIVYHLDRFSRNLAEAMLKIRELYALGIKVRDVTEQLDLDDDDPNTFMQRAFRFMMAEGELHRIRERTRSGIHQARLDGRFTSTAPWGYINARDEKDKPVLIVDEEKADIIRFIFREYINGMGLFEIHRMAMRYGFRRNGRSAIKYILQNPVYAGLIYVPATKREQSKLVKGLHPAIVSEQDYWLIQERLNSKKVSTQNREEVPLRGCLHTETGRLYTAGNSRSRSGRYYWYYVDPVTKINLSAHRLHEQFGQLLDLLSFDVTTLRKLRHDLTEKLESWQAGKQDSVKQVKKQIDLVESRIEGVESKYLLTQDISETTYKRIIAELRGDRARLQKELSATNKSDFGYKNQVNEIIAGLSDLRTAFHEMSQPKKHQFIALVFDSCLGYWDDTYRTAFLHPLFAHNLQILKEKGLLEITAQVKNLEHSSNRAGDRTGIEPENTEYADYKYLKDLGAFAAILTA